MAEQSKEKPGGKPVARKRSAGGGAVQSNSDSGTKRAGSKVSAKAASASRSGKDDSVKKKVKVPAKRTATPGKATKQPAKAAVVPTGKTVSGSKVKPAASKASAKARDAKRATKVVTVAEGGSGSASARKAEKDQAVDVQQTALRPSPASVRRTKDKEKAGAKSPFSHTDHASIFKGVEARKAAARAKQARMASGQAKPKKSVARRLNDKQLGEFEQMLLRIKAELLRQIAYLRGASLTRSDEVNPEEDGTDAFERQLALKLAAGEGDSIFEIDEALDRIRQATYGVCEECDCIIPTPRLKALPFARRCVECQSRVEKNPGMSEHRYF